MSETDSCRPWLARFCSGLGADVGCGPEAPIVATAIRVDRRPPATIVTDAMKLPFADESLDFLYSSHCLEDFQDTVGVLAEWLRVIKPGGNLVLFLPDQKVYGAHCAKHGTLPNQDHKHTHFSAGFVLKELSKIGFHMEQVLHYENPVSYNPYSFALVVRKEL